MSSTDLSLLASIADQLKEGVILYDLKRQEVVYCNSAAIAMTGIQPQSKQEQVKQLFQHVLIQDRAYLNVQYQGMRKNNESRSAEIGLDRDGKRIHLHVTGCVVNEETLLAVFLRDITQLKAHEDYLVEFGAKKNTLLDTLTHNLSGSLTLTRNLAREAEKITDKATTLNTFQKLITENNEASLKIIEDFMTYEHEKSPRIYIKNTRIDVVEKIGFVHQQLQFSYPDRTFLFQSSQPEIHITTDEVKLLQVVNNLTSNAVKFSEPDKPVSIHIDAQAEDVVISIADQGIGIPESLKPLIFVRQSVTGRTGLNGEPSNGDGLAICKHLIDMLRGSISFESTEQKGSTFYIRLPYAVRSEDEAKGF